MRGKLGPGLCRAATGVALAMALAAAAPGKSDAVERFEFFVAGRPAGPDDGIRRASLLAGIGADAAADPRDVLAAAAADYGRIVEALYAQGYFGGTVSILVDGREAAGLSPFSPPRRIGSVRVTVVLGRKFRFGQAAIGPLAPGTAADPAYRPGEPAQSTVVRGAVAGALAGWREAGFARAAVTGQSLVADHATARLDARITIDPGPQVRFGALVQRSDSAVSAARIQRIAGLPTGQVFSPAVLDTVAARLRGTGAWSSVSLAEAEPTGPDNRMDIELTLADAKPRRFGFGAELSSLDGLALTGFWLHRNILGGAERLRFDGSISGITGDGEGSDATFSARLDVPAAFGFDNDGYVAVAADYRDDPAYLLAEASIEAGIRRRVNASFEHEAGIALSRSSSTDFLGVRRFTVASLPTNATWDRRDNALDPEAGFYMRAELEPFYELSSSARGVRGWYDGRVYRRLDSAGIVLAGRAQIGSMIGAAATEVPPDFLFLSGGGGTVRGFPHQSLGIDRGGGNVTGGRAFLGLSGELRTRINDNFGLVAFADAGHVGADYLLDAQGAWHAGAGLGLRYQTTLGPIRLDVALPVAGPGGSGMQLYLGIGQSF